jgi:hypothetical protein
MTFLPDDGKETKNGNRESCFVLLSFPIVAAEKASFAIFVLLQLYVRRRE